MSSRAEMSALGRKRSSISQIEVRVPDPSDQHRTSVRHDVVLIQLRMLNSNNNLDYGLSISGTSEFAQEAPRILLGKCGHAVAEAFACLKPIRCQHWKSASFSSMSALVGSGPKIRVAPYLVVLSLVLASPSWPMRPQHELKNDADPSGTRRHEVADQETK
jgi:hypothetical protein